MLNIYTASAGAGKTYRLVLEYFKLIFSQKDGYKHTLAVTFTNKATEEMKYRIIDELYLLAQGTHKSNYEEELLACSELHKAGITTYEALTSKAKYLLNALLHDYGKLSVSTIDQFFQKLMRSFLKELKKSPSYSVELDTDSLLSAAVERVIAKIPNDTSLKSWIRSYVNNSLDKASKIKVNDSLIAIGKELFKESTSDIEGVLLKYTVEEIYSLTKSLEKRINEYEKGYKKICQNFIDTLNAFGHTTDSLKFKKGGGGGVFIKGLDDNIFLTSIRELPSRYVKAYSDCDWITPKNQPVSLLLNPIAEKLNDYISSNGEMYASCTAILPNMANLGILKSISDEMVQLCKENDTMTLHDTTKLLAKLINNNDTTFIYEKMGNYYDNIMIDEFQDTSRMQWNNFNPLIANSISAGNQSLIVGDIKQSIYKFRNSDWRLLAYDIKNDFSHQNIYSENLNANWRSYSNIVKFNNTFFPVAVNCIKAQYDDKCGTDSDSSSWYDEITDAYTNGCQEIKKDKYPGLVEFYFTNASPYIEQDEWYENLMNRIVTTLKELKESGRNWNDCAILVSTSSEAEKITIKLLEESIPFVSNESLVIGNSNAVCFIIALLRYLRNPMDFANRAIVLSYYYKVKGEICPEELFINSSTSNSLRELLGISEECAPELDEKRLSALPLYDCIECLIKIFSLGDQENEVNYLIAFQDLVYNYTTAHSNSLSEFIDEWDEKLNTEKITLSEKIDAVRVMTIHKSKGLQFRHVIIPFLDWDFHKPNYPMWVNADKVFGEDKYVPVNVSDKLLNTYFQAEYKEELCRSMIDRLNVLYVAMTRPVESLHICSIFSTAKKYDKKSNGLALNVLSQEKFNADFKWDELSDDPESNEIYYRCGSLSSISQEESIEDTESNQISITKYSAYTSADKFVVKSTHKDFIPDESPRTKAIDEGKLQHFIMQNVTSPEDIERGIQAACNAGLMSAIEQERYKELIASYMKQVENMGWFGNNVRSIVEREIVLPNGKIMRPDRVVIKDNEISVIDYKFGAERDEYIKQVTEYCNIIRSMGYGTPVKGYLWYPKLAKIISVD